VSRDASPVLFLDLDDVLCLNKPFGCQDAWEALHGRHPRQGHVFRELFSAPAVGTLQRVHQSFGGDLRYVISSTWRERFGRREMERLLASAGAPFAADALDAADQWRTPAKLLRRQRVDEIDAWLQRYHRGESFAVLDDLHSGASLHLAANDQTHAVHRRVVLCEPGVGLTHEHIRPLVEALARPWRRRP
jgi:hypothetical protein